MSDKRIKELEAEVAELKKKNKDQANSIKLLQTTNQLLSEEVESVRKQLDSSNEQFLKSRGLFNENALVNEHSLSIDESLTMQHRDSIMSQSSDASLYANAQSIKVDEDNIYSSGDDIETFKTKISDDHELLPLKQGNLKKKSENMHRYNQRYVVLYPSFLLYYDECPIKIERKKSSKNSANNNINHPKGTIYLRNYHIAIRKDSKKKRFDITFVPHKSAVSMGLAAGDARIRFRCKSETDLKDWTDKIRTAITSVSTGFIKYDVRTDFINNDLSNLHNVSSNNQNEDMKESEKEQTQMFNIEDLKDMMKREEELKNEAIINQRLIAKLEQNIKEMETEIAMKTTEVESIKNVSLRSQKDLEGKMKEMSEHEIKLKEQMMSMRMNMNELENKQKEQHKKLKKYKHREQELLSDILKIQQWNKRMDENSLQYLGQKFPDSSNKKLFEDCQKGCICLLEESYQAFECKEEDKNGLKDEMKQRKRSKISRDMMMGYIELFRKYIKTTINYASLQQAHNGVVNDLNTLKQDVEEYENDNGNNLNDDALIMASMTASFF